MDRVSLSQVILGAYRVKVAKMAVWQNCHVIRVDKIVIERYQQIQRLRVKYYTENGYV